MRPLQHELRQLMWNFCGVVKNKELLSKGLEKIEVLNSRLSDIDVIVINIIANLALVLI